MNIVEKILLKHSIEKKERIAPGDLVKTSVDKAILLDMAALHGEFLRNPPKQLFNPDKVAIVFDHYVPSPNVDITTGTGKIRRLAEKWGVKEFYDYGRGGISHALAGERGWILPGRIIANTDSHTIASGAYNSIGRGLGTPELMQVLCEGTTWFLVGETVKVEFSNKLKDGSEAKDVFLRLANDVGEIPNDNIEFTGLGISSLSIDERAVISTMCAELGAEFAVFPYDSKLEGYLKGRAESEYSPVTSDKEAEYRDIYQFDLSDIRPMVALPDSVSRNVKEARDLENVVIDQATIGSCANGRLSDLRIAAKILKGKKIHSSVRLIVTPSTQQIYLEAQKMGYISTIVEAGGIVTNSTCGSCFGGHMGVVGPSETVITSTTRNFKGRMGSRDAKIYLASSATVASSAIAGKITDPREFLEKAK